MEVCLTIFALPYLVLAASMVRCTGNNFSFRATYLLMPGRP
jgi:hypothetical protein